MPSTAIRSMVYHPEERSLDIEFVTGRLYRYADVPPPVAEAMRRARSKGGFFNRCIRDRFRFRRLN
ncbi:MAG TPA: KTSC domain-containing protein [Rhizorhapis sp.]|nr:KTSC domain-containing protein [Rhizorhapis sp.]